MTKKEKQTHSQNIYNHRMGITITLIGVLVFVIGNKPEWFGLNRSEVIGYVQIVFIVFGLGLISFGGYLSIDTMWSGKEKSIIADIGMRLIATGFIFAFITGQADLIGLGTRPIGRFIPFFGIWQERGILIGEFIIIIGFFCFFPYHILERQKKKNSNKKNSE